MVRSITLLCLLILALPSSALTRLTASVDKNPVLQGEYFVLSISADDTVQGSQPDTAALLKDFIVGPTSMSSQTSIINGAVTKKTVWKTELMSRKSGVFQVPAFELNGVKTQPFSLEVKSHEAQNINNNDVFIKTSLAPSTLYVQQAGVYNVKLYLAKDLSEGSLTAPELENAQISQLGKQVESNEIIEGKRYLVVSRDYLVQPQQSGEFTIEAPAFNGRVRQNYRSIAVSAIGEDTQLTVKPIIDNYQGNWLPSEMVSLHEEFQPDNVSVEVGTPITRTITLTAIGITKEQLPEIKLTNIDGIKSYPDQAENKNAVRDGRIVSQRVESFALLPQKPGNYTLPEVTIPWFNTVINKVEYAVLPAKKITVTGSVLAPQAPKNITTTSDNVAHVPSKSAMPTIITQVEPISLWITVLGYFLWAITLITFIIFVLKNKNKVVSQIEETPQEKVKLNIKDALSNLKIAAKQKDVRSFNQALNIFSKIKCNSEQATSSHLIDLYQSDELTALIHNLQKRLYSQGAVNVDLNELIVLLQQPIKTKQGTEQSLETLY
ncbi:protein BatD [Pseudoalteromonas sp. NBT06-2]|uniref:BatD family protein n=1 Tax=Pseudoalteromonas sp. NBT06-2 TaxID=2025950 RepID=UPI000BA5FF80|nr:BatD family protein [Pseudoalteromonas sp. NBT06-2]PAJ72788.1 protein BatD [Pseudoalteromonas sp. NBT06-2]